MTCSSIALQLMARLHVVSDKPTSSFNPYKSGNGTHGKLPKCKEGKGVFHPIAHEFGLPDKLTFDSVQEYLWLNGKFTLGAVRSSIAMTI